MPFRSMADSPLVYAVEHTGTNFAAPPLPTLANLLVILPLPDPFAWANDPFGGTRSTNFSDWSHRRAQIKAQIENYEIGFKPPVDPTNIFASFSGNTLTVRVTNAVAGTNRTLTLTCAVSFPPTGSGPYPAIIGMNSPNGSISLGGRRIATITFSHNQVTTYNNPQNSNPYYQLYAAPYAPVLNIVNTGQYSAWAWGVSRIVDYLQTDPSVDGTRIALFGHSRLGKTALWASALDPRIAAVFSSCSGEMGAALARRDWGETVDDMAQNFPWQFAPAFPKWAGRWSEMPVDAHMLIALSAPRPVFVTGGTADQWADPKGEFLAAVAAGPVYKLLGKKDLGVTTLPPLDTPVIDGDLGWHYHTGGHVATRADWQAFLTFFEKHL